MSQADLSPRPRPSFPEDLPGPALTRLFSKKNLARLLEKPNKVRNRKLRPSTQISIKTEASSPVVSATERPIKEMSMSQFETQLLDRYRSWDDGKDLNLQARKSFAEARIPQLYQLYKEVMDYGGYMTVMGHDWWSVLAGKGEEGDPRTIFEDYLSLLDPTLHPDARPNQEHWPISALKLMDSVPSVRLPETEKEAKNLLFAPCFVIRKTNLETTNVSEDRKRDPFWMSEMMQISPVFASEKSFKVTKTTPVIDNCRNLGLPLLCYNAGNQSCVMKIMKTGFSTLSEDPHILFNQQHWYVVEDPGDLVFVQDSVQIWVSSMKASTVLQVQSGLPHTFSHLRASIELANVSSAQSLSSNIRIYSNLYEFLGRNPPILSIKRRSFLAEKLLGELADYTSYEFTPLEPSSARTCGICKRELFCIGRTCRQCKKTLCRFCKLRGNVQKHVCSEKSWEFVQTGEYIDVSTVITTLRSISHQYHLSLHPKTDPISTGENAISAGMKSEEIKKV